MIRPLRAIGVALAVAIAAQILCTDMPAALGQEPAPPAAGGQAPVAGGAASSPEAKPQGKSGFWWLIKSSGWIGLFILILSIYFVATTIRLFIELRPEIAMPSEDVASCEQLLSARDFQGLYDFASKRDSFYCRLVTIGIAELPSGLTEAREVMDRNADAETVDMERKISMLAVLGTLGPMIGLVGTLKGMIASFSVIALYDTQLKASQVAEGISEALLLTFEGVALSVPAIYFYAIFKNRVAKISVETLLAADELVRRVVQQAKTKTPAGPTPATARS